MARWVTRLLGGLTTAAVLTGCGGAGTTPAPAPSATTAADVTDIDVGGRTLHIVCTGPTDTGRPTIVFENGSGPIEVFTANNNGILLAALLYKAQGKILTPPREPGAEVWFTAMRDGDLRERRNLPDQPAWLAAQAQAAATAVAAAPATSQPSQQPAQAAAIAASPPIAQPAPENPSAAIATAAISSGALTFAAGAARTFGVAFLGHALLFLAQRLVEIAE